MAFNKTLNTIQCQNGTGFMHCYKLSRTDCATVTHLYKLRPNTEQRHAIRTVRNIVKEHRRALHHREKYRCAPHAIMGRLCRQVKYSGLKLMLVKSAVTRLLPDQYLSNSVIEKYHECIFITMGKLSNRSTEH